MRIKIMLLVFLLAGLATGCSASPGSGEALREVEADNAAAPSGAADSSSDAAVLPVAGKPQLLEFYADW